MGLFDKTIEQQPTLVVEPAGTLLVDWQLNRVVGSEQTVKSLLSLWSATTLTPTLLSEIIGKHHRRDKARLVEQRLLPQLCEQRSIEHLGKITHITIGLPQLVSAQLREPLPSEAGEAPRHGLLPLAVLTSVTKQEPRAWHLAGLALLEPKLKKYLQPDKLLSALPTELLTYYAEALGLSEQASCSAPELFARTPQEIEKQLATVRLIGDATLRDRYQILLAWQDMGPVRYVSQNPADEQLPSRLKKF